VAGVILLWVQKRKHREGKKNKVLKVFSLAVLILGIVSCLIPLGWFVFLRAANSIPEEDYVDTGKMAEWENGGFIYEDEKYVEVCFPENIFMYSVNDGSKMKPVLNASAGKTFWEKLFVGGKGNIVTIYEIDNATGENLYYDYLLYCEESKTDEIEAYYADDQNYQWFTRVWDDDDNAVLESVELTGDDLQFIYNMDADDAKESLDINDSLMWVELVKKSKDDVVEGYIDIVCDGDTWYWDTGVWDESKDEQGSYADFVYQLPDELGKKFENMVK